MLECFGSPVHAKKARATLLQMTQGKMTVLQYFDAFESYLAQLEDYDESFYITKFIFPLRTSILMQVFMQNPATLLEAKGIAEELELTQSMVKVHHSGKKTIKAAQHSGTHEQRCAPTATGVNSNGRFNGTGMVVAPVPVAAPLGAIAAAVN